MKEIQEEDRSRLPVRKDHLKRKTKKASEVPLKLSKKRISHRKKQSGYHSNVNHLIKNKSKKVKHKSFRRNGGTSQTKEKEDIDKQHLTPALRQEKERTDESGTDLAAAKKDILVNVGSKKRATKEGKKRASQKGQTSGKKDKGQKMSGKKGKTGKEKREKQPVQIKLSKTSLSPKKKKKADRTMDELNGKLRPKKKEPRKSTLRLRSSFTEKAIKVTKKSFRNKQEKGHKNQAKANPPKLNRMRKAKKPSISNFISVKTIGKEITRTRSKRHINTAKKGDTAKEKKKPKTSKEEVQKETKAKKVEQKENSPERKPTEKPQNQPKKEHPKRNKSKEPQPKIKSNSNSQNKTRFSQFSQ